MAQTPHRRSATSSSSSKSAATRDGVLERYFGIRRYGSAALDLAYVAAGRFDGFWERGLKPWDIAAGIVLVREAGGVAEEIDGGDVQTTGNIIAANEPLLPKLQERLRKSKAFGES